MSLILSIKVSALVNPSLDYQKDFTVHKLWKFEVIIIII